MLAGTMTRAGRPTEGIGVRARLRMNASVEEAATDPVTTQIDLELTALRARRRRRSFVAWLRSSRPSERTIRDPRERDAYWAAVQRRLAESHAAFILAQAATSPPPRRS